MLTRRGWTLGGYSNRRRFKLPLQYYRVPLKLTRRGPESLDECFLAVWTYQFRNWKVQVEN